MKEGLVALQSLSTIKRAILLDVFGEKVGVTGGLVALISLSRLLKRALAL